ncbi:MAG: glutamate-1-semialdehyde-2,1-aminomutase [Dehalococcoidia bacterium]|nr:glutamate-1-semialdehyde-2,1-aminomutase [Dehalococcoidia bacterium]
MNNSDLWQQAGQLFPGGVSSPVRSFRAVADEPIPIVRAAGARLYDAEDTEYIDYIAAYGPLILGSAHPAVVAAIKEAAASGTAFGALSPGEVALGKRIRSATGLERIRFVNSGTEATMTAIRLARAVTGRDLIVKFEGCYHGHSDGLLVKAGSGVATLGLSDSAGIPAATAAGTAVVPYNDPNALKKWFEAYGDETAAVIVEPMAGNMGVIPPEGNFLEALQALPKQHGALLINDEIITGFRLQYGLSGLLPEADIVCLGKVIGGGLPVGALGGRAELLSQLAPEGPVYQAGTLSGNPLVTAAGIATLDVLQKDGIYDRIEELAQHLENGLGTAIRRSKATASVVRRGSLLSIFFRPTPPCNYSEASDCDLTNFARFHKAMLSRGIMLAPSQFEAWFVSAAHTEADIDQTVQAAAAAFREVSHPPIAERSEK